MRLTTSTGRRRAGFTLSEVMAAMVFLAVVIPCAVEVLHLATLGGEVAVRKSMAMRVADQVLNESLVMTNWNNGGQSGTISQGSLDFNWTLKSQSWTEDSAMRLITAEVKYTAQAKEYSVQLSTLALEPALVTQMANEEASLQN